jgi:hypothetical protein
MLQSITKTLAIIALPTLLALPVMGEEGGEKSKGDDHAKPYTLTVSAVDGKPLADKPIEFTYKNHVIKVNTKEEQDAFMKDADASLKKVEKLEKEAKKDAKSDDKK